MTTIEQAPLLPQDLEDGASSAIPEPELARPEGITEVKAPRAPARSSPPSDVTPHQQTNTIPATAFYARFSLPYSASSI
jgi:hypothetical protein